MRVRDSPKPVGDVDRPIHYAIDRGCSNQNGGCMPDESLSSPSNPNRRAFLRTTGGAAAAAVIAGYGTAHANSTAEPLGSPEVIADVPNIDGAVPITLRINGKDHQLRVDPRTTLLDCIRETVALTGTKKGCDHGQCGACTVHVN